MSELYEKPRSHFLLYLLLFLLTFAGLFGFLAYRYYNRSLEPMQEQSEAVLFRVDSDMTVRDVTVKLEEEGLIADNRTAYVYARLNHLTDLYAGEYFLDRSWDVDKILKYLGDPLSANQDVVMVTVVEGDWAKHIAEKISAVMTDFIHSRHTVFALSSFNNLVKNGRVSRLAGLIAGKIMGGGKRGFIMNTIVGVVGASLGSFLASLIGLGGVDGFNIYSLLIAVGGACVLLWIARKITGKK